MEASFRRRSAARPTLTCSSVDGHASIDLQAIKAAQARRHQSRVLAFITLIARFCIAATCCKGVRSRQLCGLVIMCMISLSLMGACRFLHLQVTTYHDMLAHAQLRLEGPYHA